jgi:hypothetical protein
MADAPLSEGAKAPASAPNGRSPPPPEKNGDMGVEKRNSWPNRTSAHWCSRSRRRRRLCRRRRRSHAGISPFLARHPYSPGLRRGSTVFAGQFLRRHRAHTLCKSPAARVVLTRNFRRHDGFSPTFAHSVVQGDSGAVSNRTRVSVELDSAVVRSKKEFPVLTE